MSALGHHVVARAAFTAAGPRPGVEDLDRLVATAATGDEAAWVALVTRFNPNLHRVARAHGLSPHEAEDAVQETWIRFLRSIARLREPRALGGWLTTTARNESLRARRRGAREQPTDEELLGEIADSTGAEAEAELDAELRHAALASALNSLAPRHRALMRALFAESEPSYAEIAARLEMPVGSIGPIRGRCLTQLRRHGRLAPLAVD